jgi:hypothetical protein
MNDPGTIFICFLLVVGFMGWIEFLKSRDRYIVCHKDMHLNRIYKSTKKLKKAMAKSIVKYKNENVDRDRYVYWFEKWGG